MRRSGDRARPRRVAALLAALLLAACGGGGVAERPAPPEAAAPPEAGERSVPAAPAPPVAPRPETREGTITLEGMVEPMTYRLYRTPDGFALPFSTYVPADMEPESVSSGEGEAVRFVVAFAGARNERAFLHFFVYPAGTTEAEARERFAAVSEGTAVVPPAERTYPWVIDERAGQKGDLARHTALGERAGRYFHLLAEYPAEMGDGMGPRIAEIVRAWRWAEGDEPLGGGARE